MGPADDASQKSNKPRYSRFTQQELSACKPILTPKLVILTFLFIGVSFIVIGVSHLSASDEVVEVIDNYDEVCIPSNYTDHHHAHEERIQFIQNSHTNKTCIRTLIVPKDMKSPIYVYYQLDEFYQNHRRYVKSRNDEQYRSPGKEQSTKDCEPEAEGEGKRPIVPCGLIAWSLFNDTYTLLRNNDAVIPINKTDIAWKSDKTYKFGSDVYPKNFQSGGLIGGASLNASIPLSEQEDLLVWMRTAALPTFRKLYGRIEMDLKKDERMILVIQNRYNTYTFNGKKNFVLSTTTWVGGKNPFLGKVYVSVGAICLFTGIVYVAVYILKPRQLGDPSYLSWNKYPVSSID